MYLVRTVRPSVLSVDVATVKANKRVSHTSEDTLIEGWIRAAEELIERSTNRAIMRQTYRLIVPIIRPTVTLFRPPMEGEVTIVSAKRAIAGVPADLDANAATLGEASMLPTATFGEIDDVDSGTMEIVYQTGAPDAAAVPPGIKQAVLLLASHYYSNREAVSADRRAAVSGKPLAYGVEAFVGAYRIPNVNMPVNEAE